MKAMILAAGLGKRLGELTKCKPKPLLTVKGKPLIDYHIEKLISAGFKTIAINTHYLGNQISDHVINIFGQRITFYVNKTGLVYRTIESIKHYIQVCIKKYGTKTLLLSTSSYEFYLIKHHNSNDLI